MGLYDLPASFDYITELTGYPKLAYIGHSQGTTQMFYGLAHNEAYFAEKVNLFVALAPVTKISHTKSILGWISQVYDEFEDTVEFLQLYNMFHYTWLSQASTEIMCDFLEAPCNFLEKHMVTNDP